MPNDEESEITFSCHRLRGRVMTTEDWRAVHDAHCDANYERSVDERPPSYNLVTLTCKCGASHVDAEDK